MAGYAAESGIARSGNASVAAADARGESAADASEAGDGGDDVEASGEADRPVVACG